MKHLILATIVLALMVLVGCSSESGDEAANQTAEATDERVLNHDAPIQTKPSGVRYQDLYVGEGKEIVDGMYVQFEYDIYFADTSGLVKGRQFHSSKMSLQPYLARWAWTRCRALVTA